MFTTLNTLSLLALAGSVLAAPAPVANADVKVVYQTVVHTEVANAVVTVQAQGYGQPAAPTVTVVQPTPTPAPQAPSSTKAPAASTPTPTASASSGYMSIVNEWRGKLGLPELTRDTKMENNDLACLKKNPGVMSHILNDGTYGQVLAPGGPNDFEHVFVGGWLCEKPDMPGMDGICATQSKGWAYDTTGHADILSSSKYTKIGCTQSDGIWGCDLSY